MRTSFDFPDDLMRHLKSRAALEGKSMRDLVLELINTGLTAGASTHLQELSVAPNLPTISLGRPLNIAPDQLSNAKLSEISDL